MVISIEEHLRAANFKFICYDLENYGKQEGAENGSLMNFWFCNHFGNIIALSSYNKNSLALKVKAIILLHYLKQLFCQLLVLVLQG